MSAITAAEAAELLAREGRYLDTRDWDAWLDLYVEDAVYWVPAWKSESEPTDDPDRELSLIYYDERGPLADRAWRNKSGGATAATPMWRTAHAVNNVLVVPAAKPDEAEIRATWTVHTFNPAPGIPAPGDPAAGGQHVYFGLYEITLRRVGEAWKIARKKVLLLNDTIPTVLDVYML